jgi:hypothetical protein
MHAFATLCPGVPDDHRALHAQAAAAGMSLSDYLREKLVRLGSRPPVVEVFARASARHGGAPLDAIVGAVWAERSRPGA